MILQVRYPTGPFYNPHIVPILDYVWLSRGLPLLGHPSQVSCALLSSGARYNEFSPGTDSSVGQRGQQYPQLALGTVPELRLQDRLPVLVIATWRLLVFYHTFLDKTNFAGILTPRARYPQDLLQSPHGPSPELCRALPGTDSRWAKWATLPTTLLAETT